MIRESNRNQLPKDVPNMIRQPQSWKPKDPKANKINNLKTFGVVQNHLKSKYWTREETKPNEYSIKEKILDVLKISPGHQGKSLPMTEHRLAEISLREIYQTKGKILTNCHKRGSRYIANHVGCEST